MATFRRWLILSVNVGSFLGVPLAAAQSSGTHPPDNSATGSNSNSPGEGQPPANRLKVLKGVSNVDSLVVEMGSPEARERGHAAQSLAGLGNGSDPVRQSLLEALTDFVSYEEGGQTHVVSKEAAVALMAIDAKAVIPVPTLSKLTRAATASTDHHLVTGGWVARCDKQSAALATLSALGSLAQSSLSDVVRVIHKPCGEGPAFETALALGPPSTEQRVRLQSALLSPDADVRRAVVDYIGEAHMADAMPALGRAVSDGSSSVRLSALAALEKLHSEGEARVPLLKPLLQDDSADIRRRSMALLMKIAPDSPATLLLLQERLKDSDPSVALDSARLLSKKQPSNHALQETLVALAKNVDSTTGVQAADILKTLGHHTPQIDDALEPYEERDHQKSLEQAMLSTTTEERAQNAKGMFVQGIRIAKDIHHRLPENPGRVFLSSVRKVSCWCMVTVPKAPASVRHLWFMDDKLVYETTLVIAETQTSVWSTRHIQPGKWRVEVRTQDSDEALASASFTVTRH